MRITEAVESRKQKLRQLFVGIPTLTKFIVLSMAAITVYTVVLIWLQVQYSIWIDTDYSKLWYGFWGSEIFLCSGLKTGKLILTNNNRFTGQCGSKNYNSDDAVG